jgi:hypothetical protein
MKTKGGGKKGSKKDGVGGGLVCAHCKKLGELDTMKRCGRCRRACYCSVECQKLRTTGEKAGTRKCVGKREAVALQAMGCQVPRAGWILPSSTRAQSAWTPRTMPAARGCA